MATRAASGSRTGPATHFQEIAMTPSTTFPTGTNPTVGQAAERAHEVVDRAAQKLAPTVDKAALAAHETIDRAAGAATGAADWAQDASRKLADRSTEMSNACSTFVRAQPIMSVVGALAIGYLFGRVFR